MTLKDISNGPDSVIWVSGIILAIFSIILLTGHGANLIAGYNTASKEEKDKDLAVVRTARIRRSKK